VTHSLPRPRRRCKMDDIVKHVSVAVLLLVLLGVSACGEERTPASIPAEAGDHEGRPASKEWTESTEPQQRLATR